MTRFFDKIKANLVKFLSKWQAIFITAPSVTLIVMGANYLGMLQILEWAAYDQFFRLRRSEDIDRNIVIVTIDETDLTQLNQWPLSDQVIAQTLNLIKAQKPRVIALDLYRDLVVEPGHEQLVEVFNATPNLIGVEKVSGRPIAPPPILAKKGQVALADLVVDPDSKVRRALLSVRRKDGTIQLSLGLKSALNYLEKEGIVVEAVPQDNEDSKNLRLRLGKAEFSPVKKDTGAYVNVDNGGYQILLNYRGLKDKFLVVPLQDLLTNNIAPNLMRDRLVFIGSIAESLNDKFYTPYSSILNPHPLRTSGVVIHVNIASQVINAAKNGRNLIRGIPNSWEQLSNFAWALVGSIVSWKLVNNHQGRKNVYAMGSLLLMSLICLGTSLIGTCYFLFLQGWWFPVIAPGLALFLSVLCIPSYQNFEWQRIASFDSLTGIPNRRYFNLYLDQAWKQHQDKRCPISIIICDVDYFKLYNDTYSHPEGDRCLKRVAQEITKTVRKTDIAVRYGGEEFAVILPNTHAATAQQVAERICEQIRDLHLEHKGSKISDYVTLSCGSASIVPDKDFSPTMLLSQADQALYLAKQTGRNRSCP